MPGLPVNITTTSVPDDYCPTSLQEAWPFLTSLLQATLSGSNTTFSFGPDPPDNPNDQDRPWLKTDANGRPERWYVFVDGAWISRHPSAPGTVIMYEGTEASIETFDGGEPGIVAVQQGPMWEKVSSMDARFPVGPGTLPSGTVITITGAGAQGGEEKHTIARDELPNIQLETESVRRNNVEESGTGAATVYVPDTTVGSFVVNTPLKTESLNGDETQVASNNLPPYQAIWFIRRTARLHYRI